MKIKYKNLQLLVKFSRIQKNIAKYKLQPKSIVPYTPIISSIVLYTHLNNENRTISI